MLGLPLTTSYLQSLVIMCLAPLTTMQAIHLMPALGCQVHASSTMQISKTLSTVLMEAAIGMVLYRPIAMHLFQPLFQEVA